MHRHRTSASRSLSTRSVPSWPRSCSMRACLDRASQCSLEAPKSRRPVHFGRFCRQGETMSLINPEEHQPPEPPRGHIRMVYLGPVAPHWEVESEFGDRAVIEEFRQRALARLVLLPPHDPQLFESQDGGVLLLDGGPVHMVVP